MHLDRITHDPAVMGGKPCIRGLRVTVGTILGLLAADETRERILQGISLFGAGRHQRRARIRGVATSGA
jgi:hypothetical protein